MLITTYLEMIQNHLIYYIGALIQHACLARCTQNTLRNMYLNNKLIEPGGISVDGVEIDINKIDVPSCFVSTIDDHIAGAINPPEANKYGFRATSTLPADCEAWAEKAEMNDGSWWPEWQRWVKQKAGKQVPARTPGDAELSIIEDAPGRYVRVRSTD